MLTKSEIEKFIDDPVWKVFKNEMQDMYSNIVASVLCSNEPMEIYRAQGRAEVLADLMKWPDMQLETINYV